MSAVTQLQYWVANYEEESSADGLSAEEAGLRQLLYAVLADLFDTTFGIPFLEEMLAAADDEHWDHDKWALRYVAEWAEKQ